MALLAEGKPVFTFTDIKRLQSKLGSIAQLHLMQGQALTSRFFAPNIDANAAGQLQAISDRSYEGSALLQFKALFDDIDQWLQATDHAGLCKQAHKTLLHTCLTKLTPATQSAYEMHQLSAYQVLDSIATHLDTQLQAVSKGLSS